MRDDNSDNDFGQFIAMWAGATVLIVVLIWLVVVLTK
jgi:hypothetical protein